MSEETTPKDETTEGTETADAAAEQKSDAFTQTDVDRIVKDRLERERSKFADYSDLQAKASKFDEFEESQKTEQQKLTDKAAAAEAKTATTEAELARVKAAVKHGLTEDDLELLGTHGTAEEIDARAEKLAARIKTADANKPKPNFGGGDQGTNIPGSDSLDADIAAATAAGNFQLAIQLKQQRSAALAENKKS